MADGRFGNSHSGHGHSDTGKAGCCPVGDSVLGLLQFGWNALFKGHVLVGLYKGEYFRSFQTLTLNVSTSDTKMHVSAFWVYYSLGGKHFSRVTYWCDCIRVSVLGLFKHWDRTCHPVTPRCTCQRLRFFTVWVECTSLTFYLPHNNDKLLMTVSWVYCSLDGVYLSGVVYVRVKF